MAWIDWANATASIIAIAVFAWAGAKLFYGWIVRLIEKRRQRIEDEKQVDADFHRLFGMTFEEYEKKRNTPPTD